MGHEHGDEERLTELLQGTTLFPFLSLFFFFFGHIWLAVLFGSFSVDLFSVDLFFQDVEAAATQLIVDEGKMTEKEFKAWKKAYSGTV